jgi:hypothetical protein
MPSLKKPSLRKTGRETVEGQMRAQKEALSKSRFLLYKLVRK